MVVLQMTDFTVYKQYGFDVEVMDGLFWVATVGIVNPPTQ